MGKDNSAVIVGGRVEVVEGMGVNGNGKYNKVKNEKAEQRR